MIDFPLGFGSDNHSGTPPEILEAIAAVNHGHAPSYGTDVVSHRAQSILQKHFGAQSKSLFVFNGTAANVVSLACMVPAHGAVLCSEHAHLFKDECAAPERFIGCKLITLAAPDGKIRAEQIEKAVVRRGDQHFAQIHAVSITQPTEVGTVYSLQELQDIVRVCKKLGLKVHIDGTRLPNAAVSLGCSLAAMTSDMGVDVVSMGGTKNGLLFGEAVVFCNPDLSADSFYIRKQAMQLPSKSRFVAAQFEVFLGTDFWHKNASHSLQMAKYLELKIRELKVVDIDFPVQSNAVFARIPQPLVKPLRQKHFFYIWDEDTFVARLMTSFNTTTEQIDQFAADFRNLLALDHRL